MKNNTMKILTWVTYLWCVISAIIPNLILATTEGFSATGIAASLLVPMGIYLLWLSWNLNIGRSALWMTVVFVLCAFEIVLLALYGNSTIAVDMWLNVVTTNSREAGELLGNLMNAIGIVLALYLPPIILGIVCLSRKARLSKRMCIIGKRTGLSALAVGIVAIILSAAMGTFNPLDDIFPINAVKNAFTAIHRSYMTSRWHSLSEGYRFNAHPAETDSVGRTIVVVIGETSRADNWQLLGYDRATTPALMDKPGLIGYRKAVTMSNTTHKSVPLMLSHLEPENFGDSIYYIKSLITAFNEAGYHTEFLSNQRRNGSFIDFFGEEADNVIFLKDTGETEDEALLPLVRNAIENKSAKDKLIVVHTYGSHFNYRDRYTEKYAVFEPDSPIEAKPENRDRLINAYDNTILATSSLLSSIIDMLEDNGTPSVLIYASDHGEDIYDDDRERFLHASPKPTYWQLHVAALMWMSPSYIERFPTRIEIAMRNAETTVSLSSSMFDTALDAADIITSVSDHSKSLISPEYKTLELRYLNDLNRAVDIKTSGLTDKDIKLMEDAGISRSF